ncbi:MYND finger family protein [Karstenula rhodostoma CBS 690.94]|uniref:MYND finger family protein n=1 Tax=Karstenula rhodostoma CBS 690.94 TaxID=1392251 RepID=A0A9P4UBT9_9PLEO|nr:MYND finger family protein [Karstenula rhodostoma CBS 690.94]
MASEVAAFFHPALCANTRHEVDGKASPCQNAPALICKNCKLVQYCSADCQSAHRVHHNVNCKSPFMKETWSPSWIRNNRTPAFYVHSGPPVTMFGARKYLWGNIPALGILNVVKNEGVTDVVHRDLNVLFAASGDIRNLVKTVTTIPDAYDGTWKAVINDRDFDVVGRNIILLMTALSYTAEVATPIMIHLWYSALIPSCMLHCLQVDILPLIEDVCGKVKDKSPDNILAKTFKLTGGDLRVALRKAEWSRLADLFNVRGGLTSEKATAIRQRNTMAPEREDYVDRALLDFSPVQRELVMHFRRTGVLIPFGSSQDKFDTPNPTFFQGSEWPMKDDANPFWGWERSDWIKNVQTAEADELGALFFYLRDTLHEFCLRIQKMKSTVWAFNEDASHLPKHVDGSKFDRIEISNICDRGYMGPESCVRTFGPMLKDKGENSKASLLMLFMNATPEENHVQPSYLKQQAFGSSMIRLNRLWPVDKTSMKRQMMNENAFMQSADFISRISCHDMFLDFDKLFQPMLKETNRYAIANGMRVKNKPTIIDKWPYRVSDTMTKKEFDDRRASGLMGYERYVELERV